jgi:hypothetical protein
MKKAVATQNISVLDLDGSELSQGLTAGLKAANFKIEQSRETDAAAAVEAAKRGEAYILLVIPRGFGESVARLEPIEVATYTFLRSFSIGGIRKSEVLRAVINATNAYLPNSLRTSSRTR